MNPESKLPKPPKDFIFEDEIQSERKKVWLNAWCSMATNNDIASFEVCTKAADQCLKDFEERFNTK